MNFLNSDVSIVESTVTGRSSTIPEPEGSLPYGRPGPELVLYHGNGVDGVPRLRTVGDVPGFTRCDEPQQRTFVDELTERHLVLSCGAKNICMCRRKSSS